MLSFLLVMAGCRSQEAPEVNPNVPASEDSNQNSLGARAAPTSIDAAPRPAPDARPTPAQRRLAPTPEWNPTHATIRMLRKMGEEEWELTPFLNPQKGVFHYKNTPDWEGRTFSSTLLCHQDLLSAQAKLLAYFKTTAKRIESDGVELTSCSNKPRPPYCLSSTTGEYEPDIFYRFVDGERGIELAAIFELDMGRTGTDEGFGKRILANAEKAWATAQTQGCPAG